MSLQYLDPSRSLVLSNRTGALYSSSGMLTGRDPISGVDPFPDQYYSRVSGMGEHVEIAPWGHDNLDPLRWIALLDENNIAPSLLNTQVNFAVGERHYTYVEDLRYDERTDTMQVARVPYQSEAVDTFLRKLDKCRPGQFFRKRAMDYYFSGNIFNRFVLSRDPDKYGIAYIDHVDCSTARLERMKKGRINHAYISEDWTSVRFDPEDKKNNNTFRFKMWKAYAPLEHFRSIYHTRIYSPGKPYYGRQPWHSATNWIGFANRIPVWMSSNIDNSYNIKYHVIWPDYYFDYTKSWSKKEQQAEKDRVFDEFDNWLAGKDNVGKAFFSKGKVDKVTGKLMESWRIEPVKNDIQDRAWIDSYKTSQGALTAGFDVNPNLANIPAEGKFSTSGSELRIAAQLHQALKVQACQAAVVEPIEKALRINAKQGVPGFDNPDVKIGFISRNVLTLDQQSSGIAAPPTQLIDID